MQFNQLTDQGEADAETAWPAIKTALALHEEVKHARKKIRRGPITIVPHREDGLAFLALHVERGGIYFAAGMARGSQRKVRAKGRQAMLG